MQQEQANWADKFERLDQMSDVMKLVVFDELVKKLEKLLGSGKDQDQVRSLVTVLKKFEPEFLLQDHCLEVMVRLVIDYGMEDIFMTQTLSKLKYSRILSVIL